MLVIITPWAKAIKKGLSGSVIPKEALIFSIAAKLSD
jgi:hypothetical protein